MAITLEEIRLLTVKGQTEGVDKVAADLDRVAAAQTRVTTTAGGMATAQDTSARSTLSAGKQFDTLLRSIDPATKAHYQLEQGQRKVQAALNQGAVSAQLAAQALTQLSARHTAAIAAVNDNASALHGHTEAVGLNRMQMMEATHVGRSMFDMIAAGQSPLRALQVEGARIAQIFASGSGGVTGTLKGVGAMAVSAATGWVGLGVAVAGAAGIGVAAALSWASSQDRLAASLEGVGRRAGMTLTQINAVAAASAHAGKITGGEGRDLAAGFAHAGIGADVTSNLITSSKAYGRVTDQGTADAGKQLADIFADPAKGLGELDKQLGMVDDRLSQTIHNLEAQGKIEDARRVLSDALNQALAQTTDRTWSLSKGFEEAKSSLSNVFAGLGHGIEHQVNGPTLEEQKAAFIKQIDDLTKAMASAVSGQGQASHRGFGAQVGSLLLTDEKVGTGQNDRQLGALQARLADVVNKMAAAETKAAADKAEADAQAKSQQAGDIVRSVLPDLVRGQNVANQIEMLQAALSSPQILQHMLPGQAAQAGQALSNLGGVQANADPMLRMQQDHQLALASADAFSIAEKTAVEARRAELAVLRESGDVIKASIAAENKRTEAIAKANADAHDNLEIAKQDSKLVLMSPYERGRQEIKNQFEGYGGVLNKNSSTASEWKEAWKPIGEDFHRVVVALEAMAAGKTAAGSLGSVGNANAPGNLMPLFAQASASSGVPISVLTAMARQESGFSNPANGQGIMQIVPSTAANPGYGVSPINPAMRNDPATNISFGADYFAARARASGVTDFSDPAQLAKALTAYNGGGDPNYAAHVMRFTGGTANDNVADTAAASDRQREAIKLSDFDKGQQFGPMAQGNRDLQAQTDAFNALQAVMGQSASKIAEVNKQQELLGAFTRAGVPVTDEMHASVDQLAAGYGRLAAQQEAAQKLTAQMDSFRSISRDALGTFVNDIAKGTTAAKALHDAISSIAQKLLSVATDNLISGLFGKSGSSGGGLFGGSIGSLFSGSDAAPAAAGIGGLFADGGIMTSRGPLSLNRYADGGVAHTPQLAMFGEGSGPEAYVPLKNGAIPVALSAKGPKSGSSGGGTVAAPVTVNVHNNNGSQVSVQESRGSGGGRELTLMIEAAVSHSIASGGGIAKIIEGRYGVIRGAGRAA